MENLLSQKPSVTVVVPTKTVGVKTTSSSGPPWRRSSPTGVKLTLQHVSLAVGLGCAAGLGYLFWRVPPASVQNILWPNSFLPAVGLFAVFVYALAFALLKKRRMSSEIAALAGLALFFRLNQLWSLPQLAGIAGWFLLWELSFALGHWLDHKTASP